MFKISFFLENGEKSNPILKKKIIILKLTPRVRTKNETKIYARFAGYL
jgi:hypothetical protein